ncbi:MAG: serine/threonine protein phosphatase [Pseudomonadota bacterium]|nr:serine/threonine protein phosphatase [Pseudomonadota bacterium]
MLQKIEIDGRQAWLKAYEEDSRQFSLAALRRLALALNMPALLPPPRYRGTEAQQVEARRLDELRNKNVRVPKVLGKGESALLLSHLGDTLASRLRDAGGDAGRIDTLAAETVDAIAAAHRNGAYFGQPLPRNIIHSRSRGVGFIDFEEDPLEVMSLEQAQARDWVMFVHGISRHYVGRGDTLYAMLDEALRGADGEVRRQSARVGQGLRMLECPARLLGSSGKRLREAARVLRRLD